MQDAQLSYSLDGGTTWADPLSFVTLAHWLDMAPQEETSGSRKRRMGASARVSVRQTPRFFGKLELSSVNFDPSAQDSLGLTSEDAHTHARYLQTWLCAPLKRVYFPNGSDHFVGAWDVFDDPDNTNYIDVVRHSANFARQFDRMDRAGRKSLAYEIEYQICVSPALYTWDGASWA